ncbi:MAG TPA: alpha/beta hydrolase family protein [Bryobacteraceae bacterium]|nr:alpha/beta hydrolase family protein [Bryobacteraceae bacterium]
MSKLYARFIESWENRLCFRATNRVVRPFEWGLEWAQRWPAARILPRNGHSPYEYLRDLNHVAMKASDAFFAYERPCDFELRDGLLRFTSPVETPYHSNNIVHGQWFPAKQSRKAVVVLPHWNAPAGAHNGLCKGLQVLGISALRISLPYHDYRMPPELQRADYAVSSNVGRTMDATRQAVIDVRCCFDWLEEQGFDRLGIIGTSLGSCYACLASSHDPRIAVNVFNHCSTYFSDVVWTGLSTQHIRQGFEGNIDLEQLRDCWRAISPVSYLDKLAANKSRSLFIYTEYDTTFLPSLSRDIIARIGEQGIEHKVVVLPCGHYTMGETPFKFVDGYHICNFLKRTL